MMSVSGWQSSQEALQSPDPAQQFPEHGRGLGGGGIMKTEEYGVSVEPSSAGNSRRSGSGSAHGDDVELAPLEYVYPKTLS